MRRIGTLTDQHQARRFANYLLTRQIDAVIDQSEETEDWDVWIRDEDDREAATKEFAGFQADPQAEKYSVDDQANQIREAKVDVRWQQRQAADDNDEPPVLAEAIPSPESETTPKNQTDQAETGEPVSELNPLLDSEAKQTNIPITIAILVLSIIASFSTNFANPRGSRVPGQVTTEQQIFQALSFVDRRDYDQTKDAWVSLRQGQVWRVITPMFLHGNMFHLFFNMFFIFLLGSMIERIHGSWFFLALVLLTQIAGMLVQVLLPDAAFMPESLRGSPLAIGASGAAYGLFGFIWIRPYLDANYPIELDPTQLMVIIAGLVICMTPIVPNVANGAHLGGLAAGIVIAAISYWVSR